MIFSGKKKDKCFKSCYYSYTNR